jgi:sec-independent protein translocase protein TatC
VAKTRPRDEAEVEPEAQPDADVEGSRMPFLSHLRELRDRVRNAALCFIAAFVVCFAFSEEIFDWLETPLYNAWHSAGIKEPFHQTFQTLIEPFWVDISIALWAGIFVASPFIFYQLWKFIAPGLYKKERRITIAFAIFSAVFFTCGALFCYQFVLENLYEFLLGYAKRGDGTLKAEIRMQGYLDLTRDMMLAFGAVFELPLLILFLSMVGLTTHRGLWKFNRWFVVIAFVVGAILTPSPDVVSQIMMAMPMIALYNMSIILSWYVTRKREAREAVLREQERLADEKELAERRAKRARGEQVDDEDDD